MDAQDSPPTLHTGGTWDLIAEELQGLRARAGNPSYETVAQLVATRGQAGRRTVPASRATPSTVGECFRRGRARIDLPLVREIALALGGTDAQVDGWFARCQASATMAQRQRLCLPPTESAAPGAVSPEPTASLRLAGALLLGCLVVNLAGRQFEEFLQLPIHLDMVGTAIAALALGPWRGALVGGATNVAAIAISGLISLPFALVNITGALVWGYGARRYGMGRSLPRFFLLCLAAATACTMVAVPIIQLMYDGSTGHGTDALAENWRATTPSVLLAIASSNLLVSVADKVISGFVALAAVASLPPALRRGFPLAHLLLPVNGR